MATIASVSSSFIGQAVQAERRSMRASASRTAVAPVAKGVTTLEVFKKGAGFRTKAESKSIKATPKILTRVESLKLLSKAEKAGLLTLAEKNGLTLAKMEKLGLLSKAEQFGALSLATDRSAPGNLSTLALLCFLAGPAIVYTVPDTSTGLIAAQAAAAIALTGAGAAAYGGSVVLASLQKD